MEYIMSYIPTTEVDALVEYYRAMRTVEFYNGNFGKVKLIDDFIDKLQGLEIETGVLK